MNFYNEHDKDAAAWLRELIRAGAIPNGVVDERDIRDIQPAELAGYIQCHFFAGIGGWAEALRLAGWPEDRPVWTGSCPCQPFSAAGQKKGIEDERHLWPAFFRLIKECRPTVVFGEQVASALGWLDIVQADMEAENYAFAPFDLCAAGVGAPHIRQRLYFVGVSDSKGVERYGGGHAWAGGGEPADGSSILLGVADSSVERRQQISGSTSCDEAENGGRSRSNHVAASNGEVFGLADNDARRREVDREARVHADWKRGHYAVGCRENDGLADSERAERGTVTEGRSDVLDGTDDRREEEASRRELHRETFWSDCEWLPCRDGKFRPIEPGVKPLVARLPKGVVRSSDTSVPFDANDSTEARIMRLRGYGNSINAPLAAEFISVTMEAIDEATY